MDRCLHDVSHVRTRSLENLANVRECLRSLLLDGLADDPAVEIERALAGDKN